MLDFWKNVLIIAGVIITILLAVNLVAWLAANAFLMPRRLLNSLSGQYDKDKATLKDIAIQKDKEQKELLEIIKTKDANIKDLIDYKVAMEMLSNAQRVDNEDDDEIEEEPKE